MFIVIRDPDSIYDIEFTERYLDLIICAVAPYLILLYCDFVKRTIHNKFVNKKMKERRMISLD